MSKLTRQFDPGNVGAIGLGAAALVVLAVLPYLSGLDHPLLHDDRTLLDNRWLAAEASAADLLTHEAVFVPTGDLAQQLGLEEEEAERLRREEALHTSIDDVGAIAERARVGTLVLVRLRPPPVYSFQLTSLVNDRFGGRIVIREFATRRDLMSLNEALIVNCSGLGARDLFADDELIPVKGQLTMLVPQPEVNYATNGGVPGRNRAGFVHMMPRRDGIALGGTSEDGISSLEPNEEARRRVVDTHIELFTGMRPPDPGARLSAAAPIEVPSVESFFGAES